MLKTKKRKELIIPVGSSSILLIQKLSNKIFKPFKLNFSCSRAREDFICIRMEELCNSNTERCCLLRQIINISEF